MLATMFFAVSILIFLLQYYLDGRKYDIFNPKMLFQIYFIIQLPLALSLGVNSNVSGFNYLSQDISHYQVMVLGSLFIAAQLVMVLSYYLIGNKWLRIPLSGASRWNPQRVRYTYFVILCIGYVSFLYLLEINGGYSEFLINRESWRSVGMIGQGWLIFPCTSLIAIASISYIISFAKNFSDRIGSVKLILLIGITIFPASQLGFRGLMLLPIIQLMFVYHYKVRKLKFQKVIPLLFIVALIFTFYGLYREASSYALGDVNFDHVSQVIIDRPELLYSVILRSKGADIVASVLNQMENSSDYQFFLPAIVEMLTIPIPSVLWQGKPVPLSVQFSEKFFGIGGGVSPTIIGEAFWHGGLIGVFIVMAAIGFVFRLFMNSIRHAQSNDSVLLFLATIFPSLVMMAEAVQGYLNGIFVLTIFVLTLIFIFSVPLFRLARLN